MTLMSIFKKTCSLLLAIVLVLGLFPAVSAAEPADVTIETGHVAEFMADRYLSKIVLKDVGGTVSGSGYNWDIVVPADTDTTKALTFELTASTGSATSGSFFWAVGAESAVSATNVATTNPVTLSVLPEWKNGHATVVVGLGSVSKIQTSYTINLSLEGAAENLNDIDLGETISKKYFLQSIYVNGATVTKSAVSDTDFSGSTSGHKATIDITLDAMPQGELVLDLIFGATGSSYIAVDGGSREKYDSTYSYAVDLSKSLSCTFVIYSSASSSTVRGTYTVYFHVEGVDNNLPPVLKDGIPGKAEAKVYLPSSYTLDLTTIFSDPNNDDLTYTVSIDGANAVKADASYTFTPEAVGTYTLVFHANDGSKTSEESYTVTVTVPKNEAPVILDGAVTTADAAQFAPWTLDLSTIFSDPDGDSLTYYAKVNNGSYLAVNSSYSYVPTEAGIATLTFKASDSHLESAGHTVTLAVTATDAEYAVKVGQTASNGSFDYIRVTDANDVGVADAVLTLDGTALTVTLPRTYSANSVRAHFHLTQNGANGDIKLPFVSTKTGTAGQLSGKAINNIVSSLTTTLSSGKGSGTVYFYNTVPTTTSNSYTTYTINYAIENKAPVLTGAAEKTDDAVAGNAYTVDLSAIFSDPDGDALTYSVSINGEAAVTADSLYSYTPTVAATDVLVLPPPMAWMFPQAIL